ncbi:MULTISPECIES: hypothetical protein [unclassified Streptomyces]
MDALSHLLAEPARIIEVFLRGVGSTDPPGNDGGPHVKCTPAR